jgi:pilus retraction protein PilT
MPFLEQLEHLCAAETKPNDLIVGEGFNVHLLIDGILSETNVYAGAEEFRLLLGLIERDSFPNDRNFSVRLGAFRLRAQFTRVQGGHRVVMRLLSDEIPDLTSLRLPQRFVEEALSARRGLIFVCGETGSGKTTSLAAVLKARAEMGEHIITIEDPIEYIQKGKFPMQFLQREVGEGKDVASFDVALASAVRQAPKIILIGELRDANSALTAIHAANTGHLIFFTTHTGSISEAVQSILELIPADQRDHVKALFPSLMRAGLCQRLVKGKNGKRFAIHELLMPTPAIGKFIAKGEFFAIKSELLQGARYGHQTFQKSLMDAQREGLIDAQQRAALEATHLDKDFNP